MPAGKRFDPDAALENAMQLFWIRGYGEASVDDLVRATGVNRASLYATFGNKQALFLAALARYDARCRERWLRSLERAHPPKEAIRAVFEAWVERAGRPAGRRGCLLANTAIELAAREPQVESLVAASQRDTERFFRRAIRRARSRGTWIPDASRSACSSRCSACWC